MNASSVASTVPHSAQATASSRSRTDISGLVGREAPALFDYFARRVDQTEDAADLLGDTLMVVWRRSSSIPDDETRARMWLYGVARKVLSTHRRSAARRNSLAERLRLELAVKSPTISHDNDIHDHVRSLLSDLDKIDQEIIGLVYWEGFSLIEVARIMSLRPGTVRSRHSRARAELRAALLETGDTA